MVLILVGLWGFVNNVNVPSLADKAPWESLGEGIMVLAGLLLIVASFLFGDSWNDLGLAGGANLHWIRRQVSNGTRWLVLGSCALMHVLLLVAYFCGGQGVLDWGFGKLIGQLGLRRSPHVLLWFPMLSLDITLWWVLRYDNLRKAVPTFGLACVVGVAFLLLLTSIMDSHCSPNERLWQRWDTDTFLRGLLGRYILWGTIQQLLFLSFLNTRFRKGISNPMASALMTGLCFGLIHAPVWSLAWITFFGGTVWAWCFQRAPNLFLAGLVHGILGTLLGLLLSDPWFPMRVGPFSL